jgi:hypothetical protein
MSFLENNIFFKHNSVLVFTNIHVLNVILYDDLHVVELSV